MLHYQKARQIVIDQCLRLNRRTARETLRFGEALGRVLAEEVCADRDYPPFDRSLRDGYAVRAADVCAPAEMRCAGEIKAGDPNTAKLPPGECLEIMTGAPVPEGADAVVMIEYTERRGEQVRFLRAPQPGQHIVRRGSEIPAGSVVLAPGMRLGYAELAVAAQVGAAALCCTKPPRVAILTTGDELVEPDAVPQPWQIRNSNSASLAAQVRLAGGEAAPLGIARDNRAELREKLNAGLQADLLLISGGVSMGKYDLVEDALKELGAEVYFNSVAIRPGKPAVFGRCGDTPFFGLPGNPVSTMVTFELFVTPAIDLLSGAGERPSPLFEATLSRALDEKPGMTHFLPAFVEWRDGKPTATTVAWQGSGDTAAVARANCYLVVPAESTRIEAGQPVTILLPRGLW
jgi:molybdopterin molybdotransferase